MSRTIVDMAKVTQMLDNGWEVLMFKNGMGAYSAQALHERGDVFDRAKQRWRDALVAAKVETHLIDTAIECDFDNEVLCDDFTPEQALTRLAYKVHGELPPEQDP